LIGAAGISSAFAAFLGLLAFALGQDGTKQQREAQASKTLTPPPADGSLKSINDDFDEQLRALERLRLDRMQRLASGQNPADAAATYEQLFRLAIAGNLFREAEEAARTVVNKGSPSVRASELAHIVKVIAECDRGAYEESLTSLRQAMAERAKSQQDGSVRSDLPTGEIVEICDAFYQRLIQGGQFDRARKALQMLLGQATRPAVKEFLSSRVKRLDLVGKRAPAIEGTDVDGKPFKLADHQGKVVLVVFWASWCLPCAAEIESLQQAVTSYGAKGLRIVGIDLDAVQDGGAKLETVMPNVRHFLLDHDVSWPTLVSGSGATDFASAYGVTEIPANVLIGRDGTVKHIDLVRKNVDQVIARAIAE
jgi:peroxiredoxin